MKKVFGIVLIAAAASLPVVVEASPREGLRPAVAADRAVHRLDRAAHRRIERRTERRGDRITDRRRDRHMDKHENHRRVHDRRRHRRANSGQ